MVHNPVFTTCELYMAYADYEDVIWITEDLLSKMVMFIHGTYKISYHPNGSETESAYEVDFNSPFKRADVRWSGEGFWCAATRSRPNTLHTAEARDAFDRISREKNVDCSAPGARLLDSWLDYLENTFLIGHPQIMSPLEVDTTSLLPGSYGGTVS